MKGRRRRFRIPKKHEEVFVIKTDSNYVGVLRIFLLGIIFLLQLSLIVALSIYVSDIFPWYLLITAVLSLFCALNIVISNKNSISKSVWILFVLVFFPVGFLIYFLANDKMFFAKDKAKYKQIFKRVESWVPKGEGKQNEVTAYLNNVGGFQSYKDSKVTYFSTCAPYFNDVLESISKAEKYVFIEFFIFSDGMLLERMLALLKPKLEKGLDVRIIYDSFGSHAKLKVKTIKRMQRMGIKIFPFKRLTPVLSFGQNYRDHRKFIIVDGKVAYTGGANFGDEYTNEKRMYGYWKDEGVKVEGKAIDRMVFDYLRHYEYVSGVKEDYTAFMGNFEKIESDSIVMPYVDGLDYKNPIGKNVYMKLMMSAQKRLYIMTPYFVVDDTVYDILKNKAKSGVDVTILLPEVPDKPQVYIVSKSNAETLLPFGVKVYTVKNTFLHTKVMLSDDQVVMGSINLDLRSFYQQFESAVYTDDSEVIKVVEKDFEDTIKCSSLITEDSIKHYNIFFKVYSLILQCISPLM